MQTTTHTFASHLHTFSYSMTMSMNLLLKSVDTGRNKILYKHTYQIANNLFNKYYVTLILI